MVEVSWNVEWRRCRYSGSIAAILSDGGRAHRIQYEAAAGTGWTASRQVSTLRTAESWLSCPDGAHNLSIPMSRLWIWAVPSGHGVAKERGAIRHFVLRLLQVQRDVPQSTPVQLVQWRGSERADAEGSTPESESVGAVRTLDGSKQIEACRAVNPAFSTWRAHGWT